MKYVNNVKAKVIYDKTAEAKMIGAVEANFF